MKTFYKNGRVILEDKIIRSGVLVENNKITDICVNADADRIIDVKGNYISPGFIDTHIHGGGGCDVMDATPESLITIAKTHRKYGCKAFLATTLTSSKSNIKKAVKNVYDVMQNQTEGSRILGVHLEGPCFSAAFKGAQNPEFLQLPSKALFEELDMGLNIVKRVSMAPELEGAFEAAEYLSKRKINVSIAHTNADFDCTLMAADHGFSHITHMFNGMSFIKSPDYYCRAGVAEAGLYSDDLSAEIIADGKHQPPGLLKLLYKVKGDDKMLLTTDATAPTCMAEGNYKLGGLDVLLTDGVAMLADRTSFAGSVATCDRLVRFAYKNCGIPLHVAVKMASLNHAKLIGAENEIGSIKIGKAADIIIFDEDITVMDFDN